MDSDLLFYLTHSFTLWQDADYYVFGFVFLVIAIVVIDCYSAFSEKMIRKLSAKCFREDALFGLIFLLALLFFVGNFSYGYIDRFFSIVNYSDVRSSLLRAKLIEIFFISYVSMSLVSLFICVKVSNKNSK
jgi:hypothetical protein